MNGPTRQTEFLGALEETYREALSTLVTSDAAGRLAARDATLWKSDPPHLAVIRNRLGWLDLPEWLGKRAADLAAFSAEVREAGFTRVLLLGMGGSSLAPEVIKRCLTPGRAPPPWTCSTPRSGGHRRRSGARLDRLYSWWQQSGTTLETSLITATSAHGSWPSRALAVRAFPRSPTPAPRSKRSRQRGFRRSS